MDWSYLFSAGMFVQLALLFYVLGFLVRDELRLRLLILTGSGFYILYYYFISDSPLWDAIAASGAIVTANLCMIGVIAFERSTIGMDAATLKLYQSFPTFTPGQFRKMMRRAETIKADVPASLTREGEVPDWLYMIAEGHVVINRDGRDATISAGNFVGEISYLLKGPAFATVTAPGGTTYLRWNRAALDRLCQKSPAFSNALGALFNADIARKLAVSWPEQQTPGQQDGKRPAAE